MGRIAQATVGQFYSAFDRNMPVSREVELQWLVSATEKGNMTSRRRLQKLDPQSSERAQKNLRQKYSGVGVVSYLKASWFNKPYQAYNGDSILQINFDNDPQELLLLTSNTGNEKLAEECLNRPFIDVNLETSF
jgi:hypothetical protein